MHRSAFSCTLVLFLCASLSVGNCHAQSPEVENKGIFSLDRTTFSANVGADAAAFRGSDAKPDGVQRIESRTVPSVGVMARYEVTSRWSLRSGLRYQGNGHRFITVNEGTRIEGVVDLNQLQVPLSVELQTVSFRFRGQQFTQSVSAGPYASVKLSSNQYILQDGNEEETTLVDTRSILWGGRLGARLRSSLPIGTVGVGVNYALGLRNVSSDGLDLKNQSLGISLTYIFDF